MTNPSGKSESVEYKILSAVPGRLRLKVPHHLRSKTYRQQLTQWFEYLTDGTVTDIRINALTESLTLHFDAQKVSLVKLEQVLVKALYGATQSGPPVAVIDTPSQTAIAVPPSVSSPELSAPATNTTNVDETLAVSSPIEEAEIGIQKQEVGSKISSIIESLPVAANAPDLDETEDELLTPEPPEVFTPREFQPQPSMSLPLPSVVLTPIPASEPVLPFLEVEPAPVESLFILSVNPLTRQCQEQAELMEYLADQIAQLQPVAVIGQASLSKWYSYSPSTVDLFSQSIELGNQLLSIPEVNPGSWEQLFRKQSQAIAALQSELGDLQRLATIGEAKLNKWRKKSY